MKLMCLALAALWSLTLSSAWVLSPSGLHQLKPSASQPLNQWGAGPRARLRVPGGRGAEGLRMGLFDFLQGDQGQANNQAAGAAEELISPEVEELSSQAAEELGTQGLPALPLSFTQGSKIKMSYQKILQELLDASQAARAQGVIFQQIEFPLDAKDDGATLVKRFETLVTLAEELASGFGLPRIERVGERVMIRDNINPAGGGEYLTNEGLCGYRLSNADNTEQILLVLVAGVDSSCLNDLESWVQGAPDTGIELEVPGTGKLTSLFTVGQVADMSVRPGSTIIVLNTGLDKVVASNQGFFGFGGGAQYLQQFQPVYYLKPVSTGFLQFNYLDPVWRIWGIPNTSSDLELQVVKELAGRPALWEAEQTVKSLCRS